jgi:sarcosine oxidase subunit alpha
VQLTPVTDGWAQFSVAGPHARELVRKFVGPDFDLSNDGFPFMACAETRIGGVDGRLFRISFSGELAYEVAVPARFGEALMAGLIEAGAEYGVVPYGVEALDVMRIEKGHASGGELIGHAAPRHLGMGRLAGDRKDYIGRALAHRTAIAGLDDIEMVGIRPLDRNETLMNGAHLLETGAAPVLENDLGWLSSVCFSPVLGHSIGLGFLKLGSTRMGDTLRAVDLVRGSDVEVEIVSPHFVDPEGERLRG